MERHTGLGRFGQAVPGAGFIGYIEEKCTQPSGAGTVPCCLYLGHITVTHVKIGSDKDLRPKQ